MNESKSPETHSQPAIPRLTYSAAEVCAAFHISRVTLWRLEKKGLLRPIAGIRLKQYSVAEVERFTNVGAA